METVPLEEIREITATTIAGMSDHARDEMAIPSYLHGNPLIRWLMWRRYAVIARYLGHVPDHTVLEFGCGMGLFLPELERRAGRVIACDLFPDYALALKARRGLGTRFVENLGKVPDAFVDCIIAADVLEHLEDLPVYLREFAAKLKDGGRLIISGPTENLLYRAGRVVAGFGDKGDYHHTNVDALIRDIAANGFERRRSARLPLPFPPTLFKICEFVRR